MRKNLVTTTIASLMLLVSLGAIFVGMNPVQAHTATRLDVVPTGGTIDTSPIRRVDCSTPGGVFTIWTDFGFNMICFAGVGRTARITLYNVVQVKTGAYTGSFTVQNDGEAPQEIFFPEKFKYYKTDSGDRHYVNQVHYITLQMQ